MVTGEATAEFHTARPRRYGATEDRRRRGTAGVLGEAEPLELGDGEPGVGSIAPTVSRETWQPPNSQGHTVASSTRWIRRSTRARGRARARGSAAHRRVAAPGAPRPARSAWSTQHSTSVNTTASASPSADRAARSPPRCGARPARRCARTPARAGRPPARPRRSGSPRRGSARSWRRRPRPPRRPCPSARTAARRRRSSPPCRANAGTSARL